MNGATCGDESCPPRRRPSQRGCGLAEARALPSLQYPGDWLPPGCGLPVRSPSEIPVSGDLLPYSSGGSVPGAGGLINGGLGLRRETRAVERRSAVQELHEQARMALANLRINNGIALAGHAAIGIAGLDSLITTVSAEKPFLELELRQLQRLIGVGVAGVIMNYMTGS